MATTKDKGKSTGQKASMSQAEAEDFLYREADLLDELRLEEWLELFTEDGIYWLPTNPEDADPEKEISIIYDDKTRRELRIKQFRTGIHWSQDPPSRTRHFVSNVRVDEDSNGEVKVLSNLIVFESRGQRSTVLPGACVHQLRPAGGGWQIAMKRVSLLSSSTAYFDNLTFLI